MAHRGLKLKVTGQGQDVVSLTSIPDPGQFSSCKLQKLVLDFAKPKTQFLTKEPGFAISN